MLPRIVPESQRPGYNQNGQSQTGQVRYTSVWATRALGSIPEIPRANGIVVEKYWEPKNTYENIGWALFIVFVEFCCAVAFTCLAIYHWASATTYSLPESAQLVQTGAASSITAAVALIAFFPGKRGRITKRLRLFFCFPVIILLVESIGLVSARIAAATHANQSINGFFVADIILASLLLLFTTVTLYPASEGSIPFGYQRSSGLRALAMSVNTVIGAVFLIYFCFAIYGVHAAFDTPPTTQEKVQSSLLALPTTSLLLLSTLGAFIAIGRGLRPHMIPSLILCVISITLLFEDTSAFVVFMNKKASDDWRDDAFVGMFILNWISLLGLAVTVPVYTAFAFY